MSNIKKEGSAIIVIDMQNDILNENGGASEFGIWKHAKAKNLVKNTATAIEKGRNAGIPIIYIKSFYRPEFLPDTKMGKFIKASGAFKKGSFGSQIIAELSPQPGDYIVEKHSMNAFYNTDLEDVLKGLKCNLLIFAGVATNLCVETTVRGASDRGYNIKVLGDCVASFDAEAHKFSINVIMPMLGEVIASDKMVIN